MRRDETTGWAGLRAVLAIGVALALIAVNSFAADDSDAGSMATTKLTVGLWVANGTNVLEFGPNQILNKVFTSGKPLLTLKSSAFASTQGVLFDNAGDLWVIDGGTTFAGGRVTPALEMFTPAQLKTAAKKGGMPSPSVLITTSLSTLVFPQQAVFDGSGNLWVSDNGGNQLFVFGASQLTKTAQVVPLVTITAGPAFNGPLGIAFDGDGNLWIANNGTTTIFEFDQGHLPVLGTTPTSVELDPDLILSNNGNSIQAPWALIFDAGGNLWSSNANPPFTIVEFAKANLNTTADPAPAVTISPTTVGKKMIPSLNSPNGISFDNTGGLGVANSIPVFSVVRYSADQLTTGGAIVPTALVSIKGLIAPAGDNFGPLIK
ncbi:MAG TPA: hypothetical protein VMD76_06205 [Candidatus Sulfotelmatobacter sp.]|nr:hypothetical protein [Candidatus Sulfotelmatobacter sp.]